MRSWIAVPVLLLSVNSPLPAQRIPDSVLMSALISRTGGPGGCFGPPDTTSLAIHFFPAVHFLAGTCVLEHGDPYSAIVGRDDDGAFYLLADESSLQFLLDRHAPSQIEPRERTEYAQVLLELSGHITRHAVRLDSLPQVPPAGRRALGDKAKNAHTLVWEFGDGFGARIAVATLKFDGELVEWWRVEHLAPEVVIIDTAGFWLGPPVTRFAIPRTSSDSALTASARALSIDYGELHAASSLQDQTGLKGLLDLTPRFGGTTAKAHLDVLFEQFARWNEKRFTKVLRTRSRNVQRTVADQMIRALSPDAHWEWMPEFANFARSLGFRIPS